MRPVECLLLLALSLLSTGSYANHSLNTRHEHLAPPALQSSYDYRPLPRNNYHYPGRDNNIIIMRRDSRPSGYEVYQRNLRRHRQGYTQQPIVNQHPQQCLGNHCDSDKDVIIIRHDARPNGYDVYQRNLSRQHQGYTQQPVVEQRLQQCLGNHCGNN